MPKRGKISDRLSKASKRPGRAVQARGSSGPARGARRLPPGATMDLSGSPKLKARRDARLAQKKVGVSGKTRPQLRKQALKGPSPRPSRSVRPGGPPVAGRLGGQGPAPSGGPGPKPPERPKFRRGGTVRRSGSPRRSSSRRSSSRSSAAPSRKPSSSRRPPSRSTSRRQTPGKGGVGSRILQADGTTKIIGPGINRPSGSSALTQTPAAPSRRRQSRTGGFSRRSGFLGGGQVEEKTTQKEIGKKKKTPPKGSKRKTLKEAAEDARAKGTSKSKRLEKPLDFKKGGGLRKDESERAFLIRTGQRKPAKKTTKKKN